MMPNALDNIRQFMSGIGSNIIPTAQGYRDKLADTRFKPKPTLRPIPRQQKPSFLDRLGSQLKDMTTTSVVSHKDPNQLAREREELLSAAKELGWTVPGETNQMPLMPQTAQVQQPDVLGGYNSNQANNAWTQYGRPASNPYSDLVQQVFGEDADEFERILRWGTPGQNAQYGVHYGGENLSYNPEGINRGNADGSMDIGLTQINSNTYEDLMRRFPDQMNEIGVNDYMELTDPLLNLMVAKIIWDTQGPSAWYGADPALLQ